MAPATVDVDMRPHHVAAASGKGAGEGLPGYSAMAEPKAVHKPARLLYHKEVHRHVRLLHYPHHHHRHSLRLQREPVEVHAVSRTMARHHLRLLRQLHSVLLEPLQPAVRVHRGDIFHLEARRQLGDYRHDGHGYVVPPSPPAVYVHLCAHRRNNVLPQQLRHTTRNHHTTAV